MFNIQKGLSESELLMTFHPRGIRLRLMMRKGRAEEAASQLTGQLYKYGQTDSNSKGGVPEALVLV